MLSALPSTLLGLDFSCAPSRRKPLPLAWGQRAGDVVRLDRVEEWPSLLDLETLLAPGAAALPHGFVMGCDFPFGLPRPFVDALMAHGPQDLANALRTRPQDEALADRLIRALHTQLGDRAGFQHLIDDWGVGWQADRPAGSKLLHRLCDRAVPGLSSTSPLQTRYVPVGKMYFEGMARLVQADVTLPGLRTGRADAIALEAYPGLLAGEILGKRSYKSESDATPERLIARMDLIDALEQGRTRLGLRLKLTPGQRDQVVSDPKGDRLDAVLCLLQAAWAHRAQATGSSNWGLPTHVDAVEGWILTA